MSEPLPERPDEVKIVCRYNQLLMLIGDHRYRLPGFDDPVSAAHLKGLLWVYRDDNAFHVDRVDLYDAEHRNEFIRESAYELGVSEGCIAEQVSLLVRYLERYRDATLQHAFDEKSRLRDTEIQ